MPTDTFFRLPEEKQRRITDAAIQEFAQYAYKDASINRLIKAAGIPRGSFYQYFADKEDLYRYLLQLLAESKLAHIRSAHPSEEKCTFAAYFMQSIASALEWSESQPEYFQMTLHLSADDAPLLDELLRDEPSQNYFSDLSALLEQDKAAGRIRPDVDNRTVFELLTFIGYGFQQHYLAGWRSQQILEHFQRCFDLIMQGLALPKGDCHD